MITVGVIRNGSTYLSHYLRKNDYWTEGEKEVRGEWIGEGATALGLTGMVTDEPIEVLRRRGADLLRPPHVWQNICGRSKPAPRTLGDETNNYLSRTGRIG
jgi:hypothetical protein